MDKNRQELLVAARSMKNVWDLAVQILEEQLEAPDPDQPSCVDPKPSRGPGCRADYIPGPVVASQEGAIPRETEVANADLEAEPVEITFPRPKKQRKQRSDKGIKRGERKKVNRDHAAGDPWEDPRVPGCPLTPPESALPNYITQEQLYDQWRNLRQEITDNDVAGIFKAIGVQTITAVTPAAQLVAAIQWAEKLKA